MASLEKEVRAKIRKTKIQQVILKSIFIAGVLSVAVLAPNAMRILKIFDKRKGMKNDPKYNINRSLRRLKERGLIMSEQTEKGMFLRLTTKGEKCIDILDRYDFKLKKPKRWDGKWRIIIFDINEKRKTVREKVRLTLRRIGFVRLQDSVWVYPYDCEDIMTLLKVDFKIGKDILYIIADKIENDLPLRSFFNI